ncbi:MAG TPA: YceI family protein [Anaerolineaceae bacterium]|nr:YceI family protein [Anaerolineaceae bacterium]
MKKAKNTIWISGLLIFILVTACSSQNNPTQSAPAQPVATSAPHAAATTAPATGVPLGTTPVTTPIATGGAGASGAIVYQIVADQSEARYRVREQLANVDLPSDAIGRTKQISGSIAMNADGTIDSASSKITVDLTSLQSDKGMRDGFVSRNILLTSKYPNAVFVPKQASGLPSPLPASGQVSFKLTGDLTVRDVTKPVTWDVNGAIQGDTAKGTATTSFTFEDFNLQQPRVPVVLSVEDHITLEVDITLQRAASSAQIPVTASNPAGTATATHRPAPPPP